MNNSKIVCVCLTVAVASALGAASTHAGIIWNENGGGELADLNRYGHPDPAQRGTFTDLGVITPGSNIVRGAAARSTLNAITSVDGDAVRITIASGMTLESILFTHDQPLGLREFFRLSSGGPGPYYMSRSYPPVMVATGTQDLLAMFGPGDGLGSGSYVLSWEGAGATNSTMAYTIEFVVVPAPSAAALAAIGIGGVIIRRRRRD